MYLYEKTIKRKYGTYTYVFLARSKRIDGKSKRVWEVNLGRKDKLDEMLPAIARKLSKKMPDAQELDFGLVTALSIVCKELGLAKVIDQCVDKRDQGLPVGECMVVLAINRAVALNSKSRVQEWFEKTTLPRHFPQLTALLTPQNIWNQMGYMDQETIRQVEMRVCKILFSKFKLENDCFLFDPTNFYTYIREHEKNTIAKRGKNKKKRNELRQVNMSLLVTRGDCNIPVMHETYEGNVADPTHFLDVLELMTKRFNAVGLHLPDVTLVFDKGNNSDDAYKFIDECKMHFISSVRPSMIGVKPLLDLPLVDYEVLWTKKKGEENDVLGYRTTTDLYFGKGTANTLVVTYDKDTHALQEYRLQKDLDDAMFALKEFLSTKLNTSTHWRTEENVRNKINRDILKNKKLKTLIDFSVINEPSGLRVEWELNEDVFAKKKKALGKSFIFSNRNEWSTFEIAKTYRDQKGVEDQFKEFNKRDRISIMPMYHWTNQKVRAHFFISNLALLITNLLHRKLKNAGITNSMEECINALRGLKEINLLHDDGYPPDVIFTRKSKLQRKLHDALDLGRHAKGGFGVVQT
jgi:transposase